MAGTTADDASGNKSHQLVRQDMAVLICRDEAKLTDGDESCLAGLSVQMGIVRLDFGHLCSASGFPPAPFPLQATHALQLPLT